LDAAEADDFDLLTGISNRLPATLFCLMMGTPPTDAPFIQHMSEEHLLLNAPPHPGKGERIEAAVAETIEYLRAAIEDRRQNPGDDLLSFMVAAEERGEVDVQDILTLAHNALVGSTDTTSTQICLSLQALAEHPDQWAILKDEPERVPHAVMELLRYNPGPWAIRRAPMQPLEYEGIAMGPEDSIWASIYAANNDPTVFEDPRRLDVTREHPKMPLNFGSGRHGCLGRMVTLMEQQEVLWAVLRRWESFEVLGARFTGAMFNSVVREFRVRFVPTRI
jgi:cytochrome P450